jgi:hypothetical protein
MWHRSTSVQQQTRQTPLMFFGIAMHFIFVRLLSGYLDLSALRGEGTGVVPNTPVPNSDALRIAQVHALRQLLTTTPQGPWHDELAKSSRAHSEREHVPGK